MADSLTDAFDKKKPHRERHSGRKADKKEKKKVVNADKQNNPKAFAFNSAIRAERRFRRKQDVLTKKYHLPEVDRTPLEPPPILVAVVGPPKVGKTTVINNLIKLFTRSPLTDIKGPVTIVTGKKRRITFIECNNDINSMIDLAKVADLVLLLCDANFGFEMEIFEFLNICQVHGMPRIMGVLTHLDMIKNSKTLKNTKKVLKHRFWTEVYSGAKLFYLSGILHGEYLRNEIRNLGRFISVMKFRPLVWRTTHSYLLGDRYEDLTNQELIRNNPNCDRTVSLYGYIRGVPLKKDTSVHIAGLGDFRIHDISYLPDPCPLPEQIKKRALIDKEKLIYAPFSGVGGIVYDKDAVYIELGGSHSYKQKDEDDEEQNIISTFIEEKETADVKVTHSDAPLFSDVKIIESEVHPENSNGKKKKKKANKEQERQDNAGDLIDDLQNELAKVKNNLKEEIVESDGRKRRKVIFKEDDEEILRNIDYDINNEDHDDSDDSDSHSEDFVKQVSSLGPLTPKENKDKDLYEKVKHLELQLEERTNLKISQISSNQESDDDLDEKESNSESNEEEIDGEEENSSDESEVNEDHNSETEGSDDDNQLDDEAQEDEQTSDDDSEDMGVKWKDNLTRKARDAFLDRLASNKNYNRIVYGVFDLKKHLSGQDGSNIENENDEDSDDGIFKKVSQNQQKLQYEKENMNVLETSLRTVLKDARQDFLDPENKELIVDCFVTGKWNESEDASELLRLDDAQDSDNSDVFGDFEDLETGQKYEAEAKAQGEKRKLEDNDDPKEKENLAEKKRKLKERFDAEYDEGDKTSYYDDLKTTAEKQAQLNKSVFENMPDDVRVQIEGFRAGMYVRIEFENVPYKFVTNFDPTYPLVIGALNSVEGNIGYVNVRIKKHRWYSRILKTNDPVIVSLGWRRFQTLPIYSKLEDDMKFRYLKYTPQHLGCNAHFWGPITPPGTGFLALQSVDSNPEILKKQGFRIAATGVVQELDKSTQIMKKLKLIGYPMKIYKKTAFIKGMFHNAVEVAKFEGARIKTVSGIRGQIKKAIGKPEGCFRASFEDKIQLSDIVFCRTWYKVDVTEYYKPVRSLLLPVGEKNSWRGVRTTGEIKREKGIRNPVSKDNQYTPIEREEKPFRPLVIPAKLQRALPYKDKPKHATKLKDRKKPTERVAVVLEPKEQEISTMMKMIKTSYQHKQEKLKLEMKERVEKHKQMVAAEDSRKDRKLKQRKKDLMRRRSKTETAKSKKAQKQK